MFGYVMPDASLLGEAQKKDFRAHYCGVCHSLHSRAGSLSRFLLSYDTAFLSLLLTSLYEDETSLKEGRCPPRPVKAHPYAAGTWTDYAADVNILLSYHKAMDDVSDADTRNASLRVRMIRPYFLKAAQERPAQNDAIASALLRQKEVEGLASCSLDDASRPTAEMLSFLYAPQEDAFEEDLRALGAALGRFIYTLDAYDDLEKDERNGCFNPLIPLKDRDDLEDYVRELLMLYMADAVAAFESLPVTSGADTIRNVLYAGVWTRYSQVREERRRS